MTEMKKTGEVQHLMPRTHVLEIIEAVKGRVVDEFGWAEESSCVVTIGTKKDAQS